MSQEEIEALMATYIKEDDFPRFFYVSSPKGYGILELSWNQAIRVTKPYTYTNKSKINENTFKREFEEKLKTRLICDHETKLGVCRMIINRQRHGIVTTEKEKEFIKKYFDKNPEYLI
jgi:hypothetical protein